MAYSEAAVVNVVHNTLTAHEDIFNGTPTTDIVSLESYTEALFIIEKSAGATGTAVITVESCDDTTPTTSSGFTTTAGANQAYKIWIRDSELSGTDKYVRLKATESANDPCDGAIVTVLLGPKYPQDPPAAAIT
jgi:hypothetical protein